MTRRRQEICSTPVLVLALALAGVFARGVRAEEPTVPDTTGMSAAMSQMATMSEQMQAAMPEAQMKKLEYAKGDAWAKFDLTLAEMNTGMGAGGMAKAMAGFGGPKSWFQVEGEAAELVLSGPRPRFRFAGEKQDAMKIQLAAFEINEGKRRAQLDTAKQNDFFKKGIDLEARKVEEGVWELTPKKDLEPGQYGLANSMAGPVADFAIEAAK